MQNIQMKDPKGLTPYERNPRNNDAAVDAVAASLKEFGFKQPIVVDRDGVIIVGHTRTRAAIKLGLAEVPVLVADDLSPEQVAAYRLADNKTNEIAQWDESLLQQELDALSTIDMSVFGFDELLETVDGVTESDVDEAEEIPSVCKIGDLWQLGEHRLVCGDSTDPETIRRLMRDDTADLWITDPPYNVDYRGTQDSPRDAILNDSMSSPEFRQFLAAAFRPAAEHLKPGGAFYVWHGMATQREFISALDSVDLRYKNLLTWVKSSFTLGWGDYHQMTEPCYYGWKDGAPRYFTNDRTQATVWDDAPRLTGLNKQQLIEYAKELRQRLELGADALRYDKPARSELHPTTKPVKMFAQLIINSSRPGEIVLDNFGGSGTTLVAAEQLNRRARIVELDSHYCDVILARFKQLTGQEPERLEGGDAQ